MTVENDDNSGPIVFWGGYLMVAGILCLFIGVGIGKTIEQNAQQKIKNEVNAGRVVELEAIIKRYEKLTEEQLEQK